MSQAKDKIKFLLWLYPDTRERVRELYCSDGCHSQSEFIEKAIRFYIGYITAEDDAAYLPNVFVSTMKATVAESDNRKSRMMFKLAVEMAMMMNLIAASQDIDEASLAKLRGECVKEVKRLNGNFKLEDAYEWQRG